ncbi:hypothetical protein FSP39_019256 [Pinctada imbricata]|uniref:NR LBD domain-containing protein n=1 Tax=Pinctada imbricata TaxID=66713 RepID=A0AA89C436_PINIB|nr:hypothetical protein FSP39_019256 [Pinctada imbricata]
MMDGFRQEGSVCACPPVSYQTCSPHRIMPPQGYYGEDRKYTTGVPLSSYYNTAISAPVSSNINSTLPSASGSPKRSNTLENVLLGKVPPAYTHLASHRHSPYSQGRHENHSPSNAQAHVSSILDIPVPVSKRSSPFSQHSVQSPRHVIPQMYSPPTKSSPIQIRQYEEMSFAPHDVYMHSPAPAPSSSPLWSQQCSPQQTFTASQNPSSSSPLSSCSSETCQEEPIDLSCKAASPAPPRSDSTGSCDMSSSSSMLRNLLSRGKHENDAQFGNFKDLSDNLDSEQIPPIRNVNGTTRVTLAKKNMYPVGSRVSDWLVKIIQFSKSIPDFANLSHNDKVSLILNAWTRILLLYMAESNFQFAVTPLRTEVTSGDDKAVPSPDQPTMKSVDTIQNFIRKCQVMNLDQKEYAFLRMAVLFNAGYSGLDRPEHVDQLNSLIQQLLKEHVQTSRPNDVMHYSRLLLCLPALYGINCKMIENLFCKHINGNMDIEMLLKEMLQNL